MRKNFFFLLVFVFTFAVFAQDKSAFNIATDIKEETFHLRNEKIMVKNAVDPEDIDNLPEGAFKNVTFGGEKEGSSSIITRIMGPSVYETEYWLTKIGNGSKKDFFVNFLQGLANGSILEKNVTDMNGNVMKLDLSGIQNQDFKTMSEKKLEEEFKRFLQKNGDKYFSFLKPSVRVKLFKGTFPGLTRESGMGKGATYSHYTPLYGDPEKYIHKLSPERSGWEVNFAPQETYSDFERMNSWFRNALARNGELHDGVGHIWVVNPRSEEMSKIRPQHSELLKNLEAYIALKSIEGETGLERTKYNPIVYFSNQTRSTNRGVIKVDNSFSIDRNIEGVDLIGTEFRVGTKSDPIRRKSHELFISRYASQDYSGLSKASQWKLFEYKATPAHLMKRFNLTKVEADKLLGIIYQAALEIQPDVVGARTGYHDFLAPLWNWEEAPYLSDVKKNELKKLSQHFIKTVLAMENPNVDNISLAMKDWITTSRVTHDIENYLRPKQMLKSPQKAHIFPIDKKAKIDVNAIDVGVEYTGRFPIKTNAEYIKNSNFNGKLEWVKTHYDLTPEERVDHIRNFAAKLGEKLNNGVPVRPERINTDGHGHGLDVAYEVKDSQGRKWKVEWDGIGRSYNSQGEIIPESLRGGHIEVVTPKFTPEHKEIATVFETMKDQGILPNTKMGGGHINIDLKPFEGNPKAMARFIGTYLDHRNMLSLMFQHPGRILTTEPIDVSKNLITKLKNFNGTEEELKQLLYNEKFFNTRVGRKTKNAQVNLVAYLQDVVPPEFIQEDFDMKKDLWRRSFDVDPKVRKMELRLFNAPRNAAEAALQLKLTRAMLNNAFNETGDVFTLANYDVDYEKYLNDPQLAKSDFEKLMKDLKLDPAEYRHFMVDGLSEVRDFVKTSYYISPKDKVKSFPKVDDWGKATELNKTPVASAGRMWSGKDVLPEAINYKQSLVQSSQLREQVTSQLSSSPPKVELKLGDGLPTTCVPRLPSQALDELLQAP